LDLYALEGFSSIMIRARDKANTQAAIDDVTFVLKRRHGNVIDFSLISQDDLLATVNSIMAMMTGVLLAIASIALVVGGIGIANTSARVLCACASNVRWSVASGVILHWNGADWS